MKEETYRRVTRRSVLRGFKLFKQTYITLPRFYAFLARIKLVREVVRHTSTPIITNDLVNRVRLLKDKIETDRGVFSLSFFCRATEDKYEHFYESIFKSHKRLFTVAEETSTYVVSEVRCQCEEFEVRLDPFNYARVSRSHSVAVKMAPFHNLKFDDRALQAKKVTVDLMKARLGTSVTLKVEADIESAVKESIQKAYVQLRNYIEGNSDVINEQLTGVKDDGEFHAPDGSKIMRNNICHRCGLPVFKSSTEGYTAQCICCDEDLYSFEIVKVDPKTYEGIYENSKEVLYDILSE